MTHVGSQSPDRSGAALTRIGGFAILVGLAIHIVVNMAIKKMPPEDPTVDALRAHLTEEADSWAIVHGARYIAFACIALFAAGLFTSVSRSGSAGAVGWGVVGLLGATMMLANAFITNGVEMSIFLDFELLSENEEIFTALFYATRVLWTAEFTSWAILIGGFSAAGWCARSLPKWLAAFGVVPAIFGLLSGLFVVSVLNDGWAWVLIEIASWSGLLWFLSSGVYMVVRGASEPGPRPPHESPPATR